MKIIIPMAGMGKRMRPHTLTIPKPLIPVAGKPIVQRLVEDIVKISQGKIDEIAFIIGDFGVEVESRLIAIAEKLGAKGTIYYQHEPLGTAHAILCAKESLDGKVIVAFADTLFKADFVLDENQDGIIWVHEVDDPSAFGVVKTNENEFITDFIEKPKEFISNKAIIGIYYFKDGAYLKDELQYLIDKNIIKGNEYQLTDALQNMMKKGTHFSVGKVNEWLDCGNKDATVITNRRLLENSNGDKLVSDTAKITNSIINHPCYIGENVEITSSIIGPYVSIGENCIVSHSIITDTIVQTNSKIKNANIDNSMIGSFVEYKGDINELSIGDFTTINYNV
ncbi:MAG: nucleotidyltransferase [Bacteroidetes bacterium]|nr:nucleotidyltransferase [Bacteroidota bacterium]